MFLSSLFNDAVNRREYAVSERDKWISMEQHWNGTDRRKQKYSKKNLFQYQFVHHKFHMDTSGI
jgi:hypothetical protein